MKNMRKTVYQIVHVYTGSMGSVIYKYWMILLILLSLLPLMYKESNPFFTQIERVCLVCFIVDFLLRWLSADYKFGDHHWFSFVRYPFRLISMIDMLSIIALASPSLSAFAGFPLAHSMSVFRIVRIFRYSKSVRTIVNIFRKSQKPLTAVCSLAIGYIVLSAIVVFRVEPDSFATFFDALYWATVSLTTVGYGDLYPVTTLGRLVAMASTFFGIAIVALPAGIITAEYMNSLREKE